MGFFKRLFGLESKTVSYDDVVVKEPEYTVKRVSLGPDNTPLDTAINSLARPIRPISTDTNPLKRGRGRPRKNPVAEVTVPAKRGRGRPRKTEATAGGTQLVAPVSRAAAKKPKKGKAKGGKKGKGGYK